VSFVGKLVAKSNIDKENTDYNDQRGCKKAAKLPLNLASYELIPEILFEKLITELKLVIRDSLN